MKKIISVLLSCTLLFSALVLPSSAANEVQVGGFQGFENFTGSTNTNFSIVEGTPGGTVYSGTKALKVAYTGGTKVYDLSVPTGYHYTVGEWYKVSVWVKPETGVTGSTNVNLSENNASNPWNSTNLKVDHRFLTITSSTAAEWKEYTFTFQAQRTCYGLWIDGSGSSTFYLDDLKISPCYSLSAVSENTEQGTALVSTEKAAKGDTVTFTATPAAGCSFIGWYNESGSLVSADAEYKTEVTGDLALTAKFFSGVVQGFENFTGSTDTNFSIVEGTPGGTVYSGTKALQVAYTGGTKVYDLSVPTGYHYTVGEWYKVSVWVKPETGVTGSTNVNLSENNASNPWNSTNLKVDHRFLTITSSTAAEWKEYTFTFQAQRTCYGLWIDGSGSSTFYLDNLKIEKVSADGSIVYGYEDETALFDVANATATVSAEQKSEENTSLKVAATGGATLGWLRLSPTNNTSLKLTVGKRYLVSIDVYTTVAINDFRFGGAGAKWQLNGTNPPNSYIKNNLPGKAEWQTVTGEFVAGAETLHLYYNFSGKAFTAFYLDHLRLKEIAPKVQATVEYNDETVHLTDLNGDELGLVKANNTLQFKALCANGVTPVVKAGSATLTADENGVYSYEVGESNFTLTVSGSDMTAAQNHAVGVGLNGEDLTTYNAEVFSAPLWQGSTSYQEAAMFFNIIDGQQCFEKSLAYPIEDVVSVRSANLKTYYIKGVDYKIENGKLIWLENGKMPIYQSALAVPRNASDAYDDPTLADHGNVNQADYYYANDTMGLYLMWDGYHENSTVYVTYTHSKTWADLGRQGYTPTVPEAQGNKLESFYNKLSSGSNINVLVYGDSTATGASSSGAQMNYDLFDADGKVQARSAGGRIMAPTFFEQATAKMVQEYGKDNEINYYNIALGGRNAGWCNNNLEDRLTVLNNYYNTAVTPDIIYVKCTANDAVNSATAGALAGYKQNMAGIVSQFKAKFPQAAIVLISGKVNNQKAVRYSDIDYLLQMENALAEIAAENSNCVVARGSSQFVQLVKSKDVEDYLSNNINHANDFWAKTIAQVAVGAMTKPADYAARQTEIKKAFTFNGTAIRAAGTNIKQALRFKTTVDENILAENALTGNVTATEYGFVALNKDLLNGAELTLNSTYEKNGATVTAPQKAAYNAANGTDIVFEKNGNLKTFTAALTGITAAHYNTEYAVRVYVKLSNGEVHYAGETQYMSVYQCAALAFDTAVTNEGADYAYVDSAGTKWKESYETRSYLFENILKGQTVDGKTYNTAPLAAKQ